MPLKLLRNEAEAASLYYCAVQTEVSGGDKSKSLGRPRFSGIGHVYAGLSDEEVEVCFPILGTLPDTWQLKAGLIVICGRFILLVFCACAAADVERSL